MAMPTISTSAQAVASYTSQLQAAQYSSRTQQTGPRHQNQGGAPLRGDQVTLSAQSTLAASQAGGLPAALPNAVGGVGASQTVAQQQASSPQATHAASSKSVTQALEAYVQASLV